MTFSLVHSAHGNSGSASNPNNPYNLTVTATTAGNLMVLDIQIGNGQTITSITDNGSVGNTWHQILTALSDTGDGQLFYRFYAVVGASGSCTTVHVNGSAAVQAISWVFGEFNSTSGWASTPLNAADKGTMGTTTAVANAEVSNTISPLSTDLLVAGYNDGAGNTPTITAGTLLAWSLTAAEPGFSTATGATAQEWIASPGTSEKATFTSNTAGSNYGVGIASFSVPGAAVTLPPAPLVVDFAVTRAASY